MRILGFIALLIAGCMNYSQAPLSERDLVGVFENGDGFWPRTLELNEDRSFSYIQMTDVWELVSEDTFTMKGGWEFRGTWSFIPPDRIELATNRTPERIVVYVRRAPRSDIAILEPDLFEDILATWKDDGSLRYLKKTKQSPNREAEPTATSGRGSY